MQFISMSSMHICCHVVRAHYCQCFLALPIVAILLMIVVAMCQCLMLQCRNCHAVQWLHIIKLLRVVLLPLWNHRIYVYSMPSVANVVWLLLSLHVDATEYTLQHAVQLLHSTVASYREAEQPLPLWMPQSICCSVLCSCFVLFSCRHHCRCTEYMLQHAMQLPPPLWMPQSICCSMLCSCFMLYSCRATVDITECCLLQHAIPLLHVVQLLHVM